MHILRRAVPIALIVIVAAGVPAGAATSGTGSSKSVAIKFFTYRPANAKVAIGGSVDWTNQDPEAHTATGDCCGTGPGLWDSGNLNQGQQYAFTFAAAGSYAYHCVYHSGMLGTVQVAPSASPKKGGVSTVFTITWASGAVPNGFNADVQVKTPAAGWTDWLVDQTGSHTSAPYTPAAGIGTYRFRARLQNTKTGDASDWSPVAKISVS